MCVCVCVCVRGWHRGSWVSLPQRPTQNISFWIFGGFLNNTLCRPSVELRQIRRCFCSKPVTSIHPCPRRWAISVRLSRSWAPDTHAHKHTHTPLWTHDPVAWQVAKCGQHKSKMCITHSRCLITSISNCYCSLGVPTRPTLLFSLFPACHTDFHTGSSGNVGCLPLNKDIFFFSLPLVFFLFCSRASPGNIPQLWKKKKKNLDTRKNSVRVLVLIQPNDFMHRHATLSAKMGAHLPPPGRPHPLRWHLAKHNFRANLQGPSMAAWSPQPTLTEPLPLNWESVAKKHLTK